MHSAADYLGVGFETVRSHVKRAMDATGARRQVDLVRMVLSSPAWIAANKGVRGNPASVSRKD